MRKVLLSIFFLLFTLAILLRFYPCTEKTKILIGKNMIQPFMSLCVFQNSKNPLENCYPTCQLNHPLFKKKISKGLPNWAKEQINEDMAHLKIMKNFNFEQILKEHGVNHNMINLVLFKVRNKKVEAILPKLPNILSAEDQEEMIALAKRQYQPVEDALAYLAHKNYIKDTSFLLAINDYAILKTDESLPIFTYAKDLNSPSEKKLILLPDWMNFCSSTLLRNQIGQANLHHPWESKKNTVFWRGGKNDSTGFRRKIVSFSEKNPNQVDAKFVGPNESPFVKPADHLKFKYLISIDGTRCAWERLIWLLHSNSLTLKHETNQVQWYYKGIKPYVHYIPVIDESSILTQIDWANTHPREVNDMIERSTAFVEQNLKLEDFYHYFMVLLQTYTQEIQSKK